MRLVRVAHPSLLLLAALSLTACWDVSTTGDNGVLTFTPQDCALDSCDLGGSLAVGGTATVQLAGAVEGQAIGDLTLISSDPGVIAVAPIDPGAGRWQMIGVGNGPARLVAIDTDGHEVDSTTVRAEVAAALALDFSLAGDEVRTVDETGNEVWSIDADELHWFQVVPESVGLPIMGAMSYAVNVDERLLGGQLVDDDLQRGDLNFLVPEGEYAVSFTSAQGLTLHVLFVAK